MAEGVKGHPIFAALYDSNPWPRRWSALWRRRADLVGEAEGRVLDLGVGNGLNLECYRRAAFVVGVDPDPYMLRRAGPRLAAATVGKGMIRAPAESLPFPDGTFDTVTATFVLCTVRDPAAALREARRGDPLLSRVKLSRGDFLLALLVGVWRGRRWSPR